MKTDSKDLQALLEQVNLKKELEVKQADLQAQRRIFDSKVISLRVDYRTEQADVEKLEGKSLANYFYQVIGKRDAQLSKERQEAYAAKVKLDAAEQALASVENELSVITTQLAALRGVERTYAIALGQRREEIAASGSPAGLEILSHQEQIAKLTAQKREIREATKAGLEAQSIAEDILCELDDADSWNKWDMVGGGGIITHINKHDHLDEAQALVELLQSKLRRFKTELADIQIDTSVQVNIDGFLRFADYFFDGLFTDWAVSDRIHSSQESVESTKNQIQSILGKLNKMDAACDNTLAALNRRIEELILQV